MTVSYDFSSTASVKTAEITHDQMRTYMVNAEAFCSGLQAILQSMAKFTRGESRTVLGPQIFLALFNSAALTLQRLSLGALQNYALTAEEKKAAQWVSKKVQTRFRVKPWGNFSTPTEVATNAKIVLEFFTYTNHLIAAVKKGKLLDGESSKLLAVGSFTLVNTGNFPEQTMQDVQGAMKKADSLLKGSGLGQVCYGKVMVTRSISKNPNVLAFYMPTSDDLYVRAGTQLANSLLVPTILHELGHRYDRKFLKDEAGVQALYNRFLYKRDKLKPPPVGSKAPAKGGGFAEVVGVQGDVVLFKTDRGMGRATLKDWWDMIPEQKAQAHPVMEGFVSGYASKNPTENFAEMFSLYCMGDLPVNQSLLFEQLVFGSGASA